MFNRSRARDVAIRISGLGMLPAGAGSIDLLYRLANAAPAHEATGTEAGLAAAGFLCLSLGSALLALGAHIFDEVEISARWARPPAAAGPGAPPIADDAR